MGLRCRRARSAALTPLLATALLGPAGAAHGGALTPLTDAREISVFYEDCASQNPCLEQEQTAAPAAPFASWSEGLQIEGWSTFQESSIGEYGVSAVSYIDGFIEGGEVRSILAISFHIEEPTGYVLTGELEAEGNGGAVAWLRPAGTTANLEFDQADSSVFGGLQIAELDWSGVLAPGDYELRVGSAAFYFDGRGGDADWHFDLVLVPEPGTALLVASCLLLLAARRRALRRSS